MKRFFKSRFANSVICLLALLLLIEVIEKPHLARITNLSSTSVAANADPFNWGYGDTNGSPRILFIGNSLTGVNDMAGEFAALAELNGLHPYVEKHLNYGQDLKFQIAQPTILNALKEKWDYVVLQEYSNYPVIKPREFLDNVVAFIPLVRATGAKMILFENWPYRGTDRFTIEKIRLAYEAVSLRAGADIVPIGRAQDWIVHHTSINMYADEKHPSPIATYLGASEFLRYFFKVQAKDNLTAGKKLPSSFGLDNVSAKDFEAVQDAVDHH